MQSKICQLESQISACHVRSLAEAKDFSNPSFDCSIFLRNIKESISFTERYIPWWLLIEEFLTNH